MPVVAIAGVAIAVIPGCDGHPFERVGVAWAMEPFVVGSVVNCGDDVRVSSKGFDWTPPPAPLPGPPSPGPVPFPFPGPAPPPAVLLVAFCSG